MWKDLMPWSRNRNLEKSRFAEGPSLFLALHREMNRMFDDFLRDVDVPGRSATAWPHIEISETNDGIKVVTELMGLEQRDVGVTLDDGGAHVEGSKDSGKRTAPSTANAGKAPSSGRSPLARTLTSDKVKASFKNGVLTVRLSKKA